MSTPVGARTGSDHVGPVHDPGVGFTARDLGDDPLHVLLQRRRCDGHVGGGQDLGRVRTDGHLGRAGHVDEVGLGQVGDTGDAHRIALLDDDLQRVGGEHLGSPALPAASVSFCMLAWSAEAKTSAGAPSSIWVTSVDEASKVNCTFASGWAALKAVPSSV